MSKTHIVIPARYHSSRLPAKPLLPIHGQAMVLWTAQRAKQALVQGIADSYCVATDDTRIADVCQKANVPVLMTADHHSGTDRLFEVASQLGFADDDVVLNLQGDEPLMPSALLAQVKSLLSRKPDCAMATLCEPINQKAIFECPSVVKVVMANQQALYFSRSPIPHKRIDNQSDDGGNKVSGAYRHLGVYAYRVALLRQFAHWEQGTLEQLEQLEQLRVLERGAKIAIDVACVSLPIGVDTKADLARLNALPIDQLVIA